MLFFTNAKNLKMVNGANIIQNSVTGKINEA